MSNDAHNTGVIDRFKCAIIGHKFVAYPRPNGIGIWFGECDRCGTQRTVNAATERMGTVWEIGNAWTYTGMIVAIATVALGWLTVPVAFALPLPGMLMRAVGTPRYQHTETEQ